MQCDLNHSYQNNWETISTLIGQKSFIYCTSKSIENWSLFYKKLYVRFQLAYWHNNPVSWCTNYPDMFSQILRRLLHSGINHPKCSLLLKYFNSQAKPFHEKSKTKSNFTELVGWCTEEALATVWSLPLI